MQRDQRLHVASAPADIGRVALHLRAMGVGKTDHDGELHPVAHEAPLVGAARKLRHVFPILGYFAPWNDLIGQGAYSGIETFR